MKPDGIVTGTSDIAVLRNPYYQRHGFCEQYANCLLEVFNAIGRSAWRVDYEWRAPDGTTGIHAVVMWKIGRQWWCMDSQEEEPVKVSGRTWARRCGCPGRAAHKIRVLQVGTRGWVT